MFRRISILLTATLLACPVALSSPAECAKPDYFTQVWQAKEGLPDNTVVGIAQTPDGFLWVATLNALVRFDGVRFREIEMAKVNGLGVGENQGLKTDRQGRLWLTKKRGGVICLDGKNSFSLTLQDGLPTVPITDLTVDEEDCLWLSASGLGNRVFRVREKTVRSFDANDGLPTTGGLWLASDASGELWFATKNNVGMVREEKFVSLTKLSGLPLRITKARSPGIWLLCGLQLMKFAEGSEAVNKAELPTDSTTFRSSTLFEDHSGRVWVGTMNSGLFVYDGNGFTHVNTSHQAILCIQEDREGNIWVGTGGGGLNRLQLQTARLHKVDQNHPGDAVLSVCEDNEGVVWAATEPLARRQHGEWSLVLTNRIANVPNFNCVAADPAGGIWTGTQYGGLFFWKDGEVQTITKSNGLASSFIRSLLVDRDSEVWIGTDIPISLQRLKRGKIETFKLPPLSNPITAMTKDAQGNLWAGTVDGFLLRVRNDVLSDESSQTLPKPRGIHTLCTTPDGSVWIGYAGAGLGRLKGGRFTRFSIENGLPENQIIQLVADADGWLWGAGNQALFRVRTEDFDSLEARKINRLLPQVYGADEGIPRFQASRGFWPNAVRSHDGKLWFATKSGLLEVSPYQGGDKTAPPSVLIEQAIIDGRPLAICNGEELLKQNPQVDLLDMGKDEIRLQVPAHHRRIDIEFTALSFATPRNVAFKYMLEGLDRDWVDAGSERVAHFSQLPPGQYRFRVTACNQAGKWNETGNSLGITVRTPFWLTGWFVTLASLVAVAGIFGAARYLTTRRIRRKLHLLESEHAVERERSRIAKDIHDNLGASLSEITLLSEMSQGAEAAPGEVASDLKRIAARSRDLTRSLAEIVWAVNPQHDAFDSFVTYTCNFVEDYLRLAGIRCRLDVPPQLPATPLTAHERHNLFLIVKEAAHNIVKHATATQVWIRIALKPEGFELCIKDNGKGFCLPTTKADDRKSAKTTSYRHGLRNMRERAENIGGKFSVASQPGAGTTISLILNFHNTQ